jgi:hypothetical protein
MAAVLFLTMGNFFAAYLMLVAGAAALLSALMRPSTVKMES